jgi:hypothetical protein
LRATKCGDNWSIPDLDFDKGRRKLIFHFGLVDLPSAARKLFDFSCLPRHSIETLQYEPGKTVRESRYDKSKSFPPSSLAAT